MVKRREDVGREAFGLFIPVVKGGERLLGMPQEVMPSHVFQPKKGQSPSPFPLLADFLPK